MTEKTATTQVYRIVIKASAQAIWDAITRPEWTERYGYGGRVEYELKPGGRYCHNASAEMKSMGPLRQPLRCARLWRQRDVAWGKRFTKGWPPT